MTGDSNHATIVPPAVCGKETPKDTPFGNGLTSVEDGVETKDTGIPWKKEHHGEVTLTCKSVTWRKKDMSPATVSEVRVLSPSVDGSR